MTTKSFLLAVIVAVGAMGAVLWGQTVPATSVPASGPAGAGGGRRGGMVSAVTDANAGLVNMALVATTGTSYVSGDQTLAAINDGVWARGRNNGPTVLHYGNWPRGGTQWVEYVWRRAISTNKVDVMWYTDGQGLRLPVACRIKYWDGTGYVDVPNAKGLGLLDNALNVTDFDEITTTRIRLEMDANASIGAQTSTGLTEFRVFDSGNSPAFGPMVKAGMERVVVLGGRTFLEGNVRVLKGTATSLWTKDSGPGEVEFADAKLASTAASFGKVGDYVLRLTSRIGDESGWDMVKVRVVDAAPAVHADSVFTRSYSVDSPLWNGRVKALIVSWIPHIYTQLSTPNLRQGPGGIDNFIEAGKKLRGEQAARHLGYPFSNAYVHNTVEAMCVALTVDPKGDAEIIKAQSDIKAKLEEWIPIILAAQEPDGYLQTRFTLNGGNHWDPRTRSEHEGYVAGYFIESAIAHYVMTDGKDMRLYNAAKKLADCWYKNAGPESDNKWFDGHQEMEQALVRFARLVNQVEGSGKGQKYVALAKWLLDNRTGGSEYDQSHVPVVQQYEAVGHAVRATYTYSGMAAVSEETGDLDYQSAVQSLWDNIVNKKYYITGGLGSGETSEGFGPNYSLRNNAYCESCSNCGELFFQYSLNLQYQDAKYADLYEETIYNAILGDIDLAGNNFCYTNALDVTDSTRNPARYPWHSCPCCVGNIPRTLLQLPTWMYATTEDSIAVNMFVGSTFTINHVAGTDVQMVQKTDYPWNGKVAITVNPKDAKNFTLKVRVPNRAVSQLYTGTPEVGGLTSLSVNGQALHPIMEKGYALITRDWKTGDKVEFTVPLAVQRVKAIDKVAADQGRVAIKYGPLVYNIESVDQNLEAALGKNAGLAAEWKGDLLGGVMAITGKFADGSALMAVPNYARLNRGGRSLVWMKEE